MSQLLQIIFGIVVLLALAIGCLFVNDTKKKHGTCCGKGCAGCTEIERVRAEELERLKQKNK